MGTMLMWWTGDSVRQPSRMSLATLVTSRYEIPPTPVDWRMARHLSKSATRGCFVWRRVQSDVFSATRERSYRPAPASVNPIFSR